MKIILERIQDIKDFKDLISSDNRTVAEVVKEKPKKIVAEEPVKKITKADVQKICKIKIKEGKTEEVKNIVSKFGASTIADLKEEDYASVIAEVEVL